MTPDVMTFKATMRSILVKNSITSSQHGNCLELEDVSSSIFTLKRKKHSAPVNLPEEIPDQDDAEMKKLSATLDSFSLSEFQAQILTYISGYVIRQLEKSISCATCLTAMTSE